MSTSRNRLSIDFFNQTRNNLLAIQKVLCPRNTSKHASILNEAMTTLQKLEDIYFTQGNVREEDFYQIIRSLKKVGEHTDLSAKFNAQTRFELMKDLRDNILTFSNHIVIQIYVSQLNIATDRLTILELSAHNRYNQIEKLKKENSQLQRLISEQSNNPHILESIPEEKPEELYEHTSHKQLFFARQTISALTADLIKQKKRADDLQKVYDKKIRRSTQLKRQIISSKSPESDLMVATSSSQLFQKPQTTAIDGSITTDQGQIIYQK